jgi:hypothetical protein
MTVVYRYIYIYIHVYGDIYIHIYIYAHIDIVAFVNETSRDLEPSFFFFSYSIEFNTDPLSDCY